MDFYTLIMYSSINQSLSVSGTPLQSAAGNIAPRRVPILRYSPGLQDGIRSQCQMIKYVYTRAPFLQNG